MAVMLLFRIESYVNDDLCWYDNRIEFNETGNIFEEILIGKNRNRNYHVIRLPSVLHKKAL
jgi:hypothetical protein